MRKAYEALVSDQDRKEFLEQFKEFHSSAVRNGVAAIMARNLSHGVGTHVLKVVKE
jgi:hypothetical protein